jgi:hypothetical protein
MLTHPTIDQLRALRLDGMADAFIELQTQDQAKDIGPADWLALMLDREAAHRGTQRFKSRLTEPTNTEIKFCIQRRQLAQAPPWSLIHPH